MYIVSMTKKKRLFYILHDDVTLEKGLNFATDSIHEGYTVTCVYPRVEVMLCGYGFTYSSVYTCDSKPFVPLWQSSTLSPELHDDLK